ncbi:MAG: hypothetical protein M0Q91_12910 [Methanoregula sp.]|jgi:hypothetical protein|nr:hypothetical protein [Methanoregula sp.]
MRLELIALMILLLPIMAYVDHLIWGRTWWDFLIPSFLETMCFAIGYLVGYRICKRECEARVI